MSDCHCIIVLFCFPSFLQLLNYLYLNWWVFSLVLFPFSLPMPVWGTSGSGCMVLSWWQGSTHPDVQCISLWKCVSNFVNKLKVHEKLRIPMNHATSFWISEGSMRPWQIRANIFAFYFIFKLTQSVAQWQRPACPSASCPSWVPSALPAAWLLSPCFTPWFLGCPNCVFPDVMWLSCSPAFRRAPLVTRLMGCPSAPASSAWAAGSWGTAWL